jgi:hypothetical protein
MATLDLLNAMIAQLGASQPERDDPRLRPESAPLDDRDAAGLLASLRAIAPQVQRYEDTTTATGADWSAFFPAGDHAALAALIARSDGRVAPHLALLIAFLRLSARPQALLNGFTAQHLQFQMQQVLGFRPHAPQPDRAHLLIEMKKGSAPLRLDPALRFTAGKDSTRVEQLYAPVRETVVGRAKVERLCGVARSGAGLVFAPIADSADGLGAPLAADEPRWPPFGGAAWPAAPIGFAITSPLLRLAEGQRRIQLALRLAGLPGGVDAQALAGSFEAHLSGPKDWIGAYDVHGMLAGDLLSLSIELPASEPAVVDHDPALHRQAFPAGLPVVQLLLKPNAAFGYASLTGLTLRSAQLTVAASGVRGLALENDQSTLDAKKAFLPFGAQPVVGSRFFIGCPEALAKRLTDLSVRLVWQGAPPNLTTWYAGYAHASRFANGVSATLTWQDASGHATTTAPLDLMRRTDGATTLGISTPSVASRFPLASQMSALSLSGSGVARAIALRQALAQPIRAAGLLNLSGPATRSAPRAGFVTVTLLEDFLHADFRTESVAAIIAKRAPLNEPYTPKVQEITLDYTAQSDLSRIDDPAAAAFTDTELQFFQVDAFGAAREHAWLTQARPWAPQGAVALLPAHPAAGELLIGVSGVGAGDSVSLLLQVAEGSADPQAEPQTLQWSVLADDAWRQLTPGELALDTTRDLRTSGLIGAVLPRETSTEHSRMPAGLVWLRAATPAAPRAACDLVGVHANAIEVEFTDQGNDPARLATPLAANSIAKAKTPLATVKTVAQPYASFGGALAETPGALARRAAERLRHRDRAITGWDHERLVLQAFPSVYRAKCIPHASASSWLAAGHTMLVVVPDLRQRNAVDPLQPRVDLDTLERIHAFLAARSGMQTQISVRNPSYRPVTLDFKVRLRPGYGFNFYRGEIDAALRRALAPWAFDGAAASLGFGGRVVRSVLLNVVESLPWVDFVTDFRMTVEGDATDHAEIVADAPDAILVSAASHRIQEAVDD